MWKWRFHSNHDFEWNHLTLSLNSLGLQLGHLQVPTKSNNSRFVPLDLAWLNQFKRTHFKLRSNFLNSFPSKFRLNSPLSCHPFRFDRQYLYERLFVGQKCGLHWGAKQKARNVEMEGRNQEGRKQILPVLCSLWPNSEHFRSPWGMGASSEASALSCPSWQAKGGHLLLIY